MPVSRQVYCCYWILNSAKDTIKEYREEFKVLLQNINGKNEDKLFLAQMIPKFYQFFPELARAALIAQFKLCNDKDCRVRFEAIKELTHFAKPGFGLLPNVVRFLKHRQTSENVPEFSLVKKILQSFNVND